MKSLSSFTFIFALHALSKVSGVLRPAARQLQEVRLDLVKAMSDIENVYSLLSKWRLDIDQPNDGFSTVFQDAVKMAESLNIAVEKPRIAQRSVFRANNGPVDQSVEQYYKLNLYIPLLDNVRTHIKDRFSSKQKQIFQLSQLIPSNMTPETGLPSLAFYESLVDMELLEGEFEAWKHQWTVINSATKIKTDTALKALEACPSVSLPNLHILLCVLCTIPVTTAEAERFFSKIEKTVSATRTVMNEERVEAIVLLQVHRDRTPTIDSILDKYAASGKRRLIL